MDINVSLPDDIQQFVEAQMVAEGFATANDYLLALIRRDQQQRLEKSVLERMGGMPQYLLNDGNLSERNVRRAKLAERIRASQS